MEFFEELINRFSEDVDLAIDGEYLGFGSAISKSKIHKLKKAALVTSSIKFSDKFIAV